VHAAGDEDTPEDTSEKDKGETPKTIKDSGKRTRNFRRHQMSNPAMTTPAMNYRNQENEGQEQKDQQRSTSRRWTNLRSRNHEYYIPKLAGFARKGDPCNLEGGDLLLLECETEINHLHQRDESGITCTRNPRPILPSTTI
jgi:hypothetical protein